MNLLNLSVFFVLMIASVVGNAQVADSIFKTPVVRDELRTYSWKTLNNRESLKSDLLNVKKSIKLGGQLQLDYQYRDENLEGQNFNKHTFRYQLRPDVQIGKLPFKLNIGYGSDYLGNPFGLHQFNVRLDINQMRNNLMLEAKQSLMKRIMDNDSLLNCLKLQLDSLPELESLDTLLRKPELPNLPDTSLELPDSVLNGIANYKDSINLVRERILLLRKTIDELTQLKSQLNKGYSFNKGKPDVRLNKFGFKDLNKSLPQGFTDIQLGSVVFNKGKLLSTSSRFYGGALDYSFGLIGVGVMAGIQSNPSSFINEHNRNATGGYRFTGGSVRVGIPNTKFLEYTIVTAQLKGLSESPIPLPERNNVHHLNSRFEILKNLILHFELGMSQSKGTPTLKGLEQESGNNTKSTANSGTSPLAQNNIAFVSGLSGRHEKFGLDFFGEFSRIGLDYFSFSNPYQRTDIERMQIKLGRKFLRSNIHWKGTLTKERDNISGFKGFTTHTNTMLNQVSLKFRKLPVIQVVHSYTSRETQIDKEQVENIRSQVHVIQCQGTKIYELRSKGKIILIGGSTNTYFNTKFNTQANHIVFSNAQFLKEKWSVGLEHQIRYLNQSYQSQSIGFQSQIQFWKKMSSGGSVSYIKDQYNGQRTDISFNTYLPLNAYGIISLRATYYKFLETLTTIKIIQLSYIKSW